MHIIQLTEEMIFTSNTQDLPPSSRGSFNKEQLSDDHGLQHLVEDD